MSPVDMVWDEEGNIYVIEMGDYPFMGEKVKGRIRVLKDLIMMARSTPLSYLRRTFPMPRACCPGKKD